MPVADTLEFSQDANLLALDYGAARVGVAVGNRRAGSAQPLEPLSARSAAGFETALQRVIDTWRPVALVVGLPLAMDGSDTDTTRAARDFAQRLQARFDLPALLHDERLTSREASHRFKTARAGGHARRGQGRRLDSMAAALILESWFQAQPARTQHGDEQRERAPRSD